MPNVTGLLPPGTYFARLLAANGTGASAFDEPVSTIGNLPGVAIPKDATVNGSEVTLSWNPPAGGVPPTSYVIEGRYGDFRSLGVAATVEQRHQLVLPRRHICPTGTTTGASAR